MTKFYRNEIMVLTSWKVNDLFAISFHIVGFCKFHYFMLFVLALVYNFCLSFWATPCGTQGLLLAAPREHSWQTPGNYMWYHCLHAKQMSCLLCYIIGPLVLIIILKKVIA